MLSFQNLIIGRDEMCEKSLRETISLVLLALNNQRDQLDQLNGRVARLETIHLPSEASTTSSTTSDAGITSNGQSFSRASSTTSLAISASAGLEDDVDEWLSQRTLSHM